MFLAFRNNLGFCSIFRLRKFFDFTKSFHFCKSSRGRYFLLHRHFTRLLCDPLILIFLIIVYSLLGYNNKKMFYKRELWTFQRTMCNTD